MSKREKQLEKLRNNPKNVTFADLDTLLASYGFIQVGEKGSHFRYEYRQGNSTIRTGVVYRRPHVKPIYVKDAISAIDRVKELINE